MFARLAHRYQGEGMMSYKVVIRRVLRHFGYEVQRIRKESSYGCDVFFNAWKKLNRSPSFILDVGANRGLWSRAAIACFPDARILMIEPHDNLRAYSADLLRRPNVSWLHAGVGDQSGTMAFTIAQRDDSSTFTLSADEAARRGLPQMQVRVCTLNEIAANENALPDMVKIDAEGFDLRALKGATALLGHTEVFLVECGVCCWKWENSLQTVCAFMEKAGYRVFDISDLNRSPKQQLLWLTELVFVKSSSDVWDRISSYE